MVVWYFRVFVIYSYSYRNTLQWVSKDVVRDPPPPPTPPKKNPKNTYTQNTHNNQKKNQKQNFHNICKSYDPFSHKTSFMVRNCVWPHAFNYYAYTWAYYYFNITFEFGIHLIKWVGSCLNNTWLNSYKNCSFNINQYELLKLFPWAVQCCMTIKTRIIAHIHSRPGVTGGWSLNKTHTVFSCSKLKNMVGMS